MITKITLKNFRAFQEEISVRIRPITVLIGRNSAGKSSLIKFLLMVRQTLESQGESFFITEGKHVQLGMWKDLRHSKTNDPAFSDPYFRYSIEMQTKDLPPPELQELWRVAGTSQLVTTVAGKQRLVLELARQPVRHEFPTGRFLIHGLAFYGQQFKRGRHEVEGFVEDRQIFKKVAANLQSTGFLRFGRGSDTINSLLESVAADRFLEPLRQEFISERHLSPIREESQQTIQIGSPPPSDVGHRGEYAIPHLVRLFTRPALADRARFVAKFAETVGDLDNMRFSSYVARLLTHIKARNRQTEATCSLADFGFGVSQCLPIFVQGAMHQKGQLLLVEQPESQLHPTAQLELGSFFAELWRSLGVPSIVETHSANVVLRLRKLVKAGIIRPEDVSIAYFSVEKVPRQRGAAFPAVVVKDLDIESDGSLSKGLPLEFFAADVLEALEMRAGT